MATETAPEDAIAELEARLTRQVDAHAFALTPAWWQERLLDWATTDPDFRVKLLRFVDVLPALRDARSVADHVRQYFRGAHPGIIGAASGLASRPVFRPVLSQVVRQGVFSMAHRFIAGATPDEALPALRELAGRGVGYTLDLLGEETLSDAEADAYLRRYIELIETLSAANLRPSSSIFHAPSSRRRGEDVWEGVPLVNVSIKLSALCGHLEPAAPEWVSEDTRRRLRPLMRAAMAHGAFINFDVEQYRYKDLVHRTFQDLLLEPEFAGYEHVGIVVQTYLRDAVDDVAYLREFALRRGTPFSVRLVKGAYWDEENIVAAQKAWPVPVWTEKSDTDRNYERCTDALLDAWPQLRSAVGTHNPRSVAQAAVKARERGLGITDIEFQMLYGMAEELREAVAEEGYRTRVYVPVGQVIPGMAYLVRRLLENTSNQAWFNQGIGSAKGQRPVLSGVEGRKEEGGLSVSVAPAPGNVFATKSREFENAPPARFFEPHTRERMQRALAGLRSSFGTRYPLLIGDRREGDREYADVTYPAEPSTVIGRVAQATVDDVGAAVSAAQDAFPRWRDMPAHERGDILRRAAQIIEARRFELAATMVFESAKPWAEADSDVVEAIDYLRYYALQGERLSQGLPLPEEGKGRHERIPGERNEYFHEGRGVTAVIAPWNFPLAIICGMTAGALAGGNCAVLKPAAQSPIIADKLVETLREAGVPPGVVQYLPGPGSRVGSALVEHPGIDNIAFTGSSEVGLGIIEAAARARPPAPRSTAQSGGAYTGATARTPSAGPFYGRRVKRVIAEMGGKNAIIIDDDADLDQAVHGVVVSAFGYAGQKCSACSRLIIVGSAYDEAAERLKNAVSSLVVGPPHDSATFVPPVISASARKDIMRYVEFGKTHSTLLVQGPAPEAGHYVPPTVFKDVPLDSEVACEEIFGPVLSVFRARTFEEALDLALTSDFALTGGLFSRNPRHIEMARRRFRVGNLYINRKITGAIVGRQPFGGLRMSGVGEKAGGPDYVRQFMDPRMVTENTTRRGFAPEEGG